MFGIISKRYFIRFYFVFRFDEKMSAISVLNPKAEVARAAQALAINISAAKGIQVGLTTILLTMGLVRLRYLNLLFFY